MFSREPQASAPEGTAMDRLATKIMYRVEKFLPAECPKCQTRFQQEGKDYARLLGDIVQGVKTIRQTNGYYIIVCTHCENMTACWPLESYQLGDKGKAEALVNNSGFVNLTQVEAIGNMARDCHTVHGRVPDLRVESIAGALGSDEPIVKEG